VNSKLCTAKAAVSSETSHQLQSVCKAGQFSSRGEESGNFRAIILMATLE